MIDQMAESSTANPIAVTKLLELAQRLHVEDGIGPHEMVLAMICVAVAIVDAALPDAPHDVKRAGLHQMVDGVVVRTRQ